MENEEEKQKVESRKQKAERRNKKYLVRQVREANTNLFHLNKLIAALVGLKKSAKLKGEK